MSIDSSKLSEKKSEKREPTFLDKLNDMNNRVKSFREQFDGRKPKFIKEKSKDPTPKKKGKKLKNAITGLINLKAFKDNSFKESSPKGLKPRKTINLSPIGLKSPPISKESRSPKIDASPAKKL